MFPSTVTLAALAFVRLVLPSPVLQDGGATAAPTFQTVWHAESAPWIDVVQVAQQAPQLELLIYSRKGSLAHWSPDGGGQPDTSLQLDVNEALVVSPWHEILARLRFQFECLAPIQPGLTHSTDLDFVHPPFPIPKPPPIGGPRDLYLSGDGHVLVAVRAGRPAGHLDDVQVLELGAGAGTWQMRNLAVPASGEFQLSRDGHRIAHGDDGQVRIFDQQGEPVGVAFPAPRGFRLAADGKSIALFEDEGIRLVALDPPTSQGTAPLIGSTSPAVDVQFAGDFALVVTRDQARLVNRISGAPVRPDPDLGPGVNQSAGLAMINGQPIAAVGRLEVLQRAARVQGVHVDGIAQARVLIFGSNAQAPHSHAFVTTQWAIGFPRVHVLETARRVLVETRDLALISSPLP
jgi:hypothetical protein